MNTLLSSKKIESAAKIIKNIQQTVDVQLSPSAYSRVEGKYTLKTRDKTWDNELLLKLKGKIARSAKRVY